MYALTDEQKAMKDTVGKFAQEVIRPAEKALDQIPDPEDVFKSEMFWDVVRQGYEMGLHKIAMEHLDGGSAGGGLGNAGNLTHTLILEELAKGGVGFASHFLVCPVPYLILNMMPHPELRERFLVPFKDKDDPNFGGAWAITEPNVGSDCLEKDKHFQTHARKDGGEYIINGGKAAWVSNGYLANLYFVHAAIDPDKGMNGTGLFIIPADQEGVAKGKPLNKLGIRCLNQAEVFFDDVRVPKNYMLMGPNPMYNEFLAGFYTPGNLSVATLALGCMEAAFDDAYAYAKERVQGGVPIIEHQLIQKKLFDAHVQIEAARAMIYDVAGGRLQGKERTLGSIRTRVFTTNTAMQVCEDLVQVLGGNGISKEYNVEKYMRDTKLLKIMDFTVDRMTLTGMQYLRGLLK